MKKLVTGILAHVDSGKTTLSEAMLYCAGMLRRLGRVDHGDAFLDTNEIERDRGITIFSKQAVLRTPNMQLTLLDTPGHVDFSAEMERTLQVLDYAILVISGLDGVQNHTETLWRLLKRYNVPTFIFVNKMDITTRSQEELMEELKNRLDGGCIDFGGEKPRAEFLDEAAMCDEAIMERFLETGEVENALFKAAIRARCIFPCYFGSALKVTGVKEFLAGLERYTADIEYPPEFGARVYKIGEGEQKERLTYMKITGGSLKVRSQLSAANGSWTEKVNSIRIYSGEKFTAVETAESGEVCVVVGLSQTYPGEGLGFEQDAMLPSLEPVLSYRVILPEECDVHTMLSNLRRLEEEEPLLHVIWNEQLAEIHVQLMGEVQLEVLERVIEARFGVRVTFGEGSIAYKETIAAPVEGVGHYEPLRHYAEVHLLLEPGKRGSGLRFFSKCSEDALDRNWQRLILTHLAEKTHIGVLTGSPITDMKITLLAGRAHKKHTEGGDFRQATYRAVRQGLKSAECVLLEPWYDFRLELPTECVGRAMTDIQRMGGSFSQPEGNGEITVISGSAPVSEMRTYHSEVTGYTRGRGRLFCTVKGYEECHNADEVIESIGYDSDSDTENPADSVFCAHGAGFNVKWDEVREHMHVDSGWKAPAEEAAESAVRARRAEEYVDSVAMDKELMAIFERTYGKIAPRSHGARISGRPPERPYRHIKARPLPEGPEYLLVDGYNIIFAWEELSEIAKSSLESARNRLIDILCNYRGFKQCEVILVFDAYKVKGSRGEVERINNINVVYTKEAETADMYIEKVTRQIGRKHRVKVATSDNLEQIIILGSGAVRMPASELWEEIQKTDEAIREFLSGQ